MAKKLIEIKNIVKRFDNQVVLKGINLDINENEFVTLLGPSGCGKTTLLRIIAGFLDPDEGQVLLDGEDIATVPAYKRDVNTVFQHYALFPHLDVYDNIAFGLTIKKQPKDIIHQKDDAFVDEQEDSTIHWIIPNAQKNEMEPIIIELEAGGESKVIEPHEGEEFGYVLRGRVLLVRDSNKDGDLLRKGDSFYIRGDESHYLKNDTDKKTVVLWVSTPPEF